MANVKLADTTWYPSRKLIITQLSGDVDEAGITKWMNSLETCLNKLPDDQAFKILVNLHGYKAVDLNAHRTFREIIPETLARYGWKTGYVNLFEEAKKMEITTTRGITCKFAAHIHDDQTKIEKYETMFGKINEQFFTDVLQGQVWIEQQEI